MLWALENGAKGCISGLGNVMPEVLAAIVQGFNAGDAAAAERAQAAFAAFRTDLYGLGYPPALTKRALYLMDPSVGASRQPALLPDPEQDAKIAELLQQARPRCQGSGLTGRGRALALCAMCAERPTDWE